MKTFIWLLSICILTLSCVSCEDFAAQPDNKTQVSASVKKNQNHADADNCSPLCACNCCGQPLVFTLKSSLSAIQKSEKGSQNEPEYKNSFTSGFLKNIWQPPKLKMNTIG
ncbi:DUF6660 family protein [Pedobacter rhodius]|uniref:Uncharacterized protein n=1 Tax=Pedobacter rhodius TaxID=3004098 RepID=A0ABT4KSG5_9SPHI|nr:DUF6660 family protein [Pedobacter sp. SJ11]MCZ4221869.1 hypothetical protein [Pedobacter sp. SJ11]